MCWKLVVIKLGVGSSRFDYDMMFPNRNLKSLARYSTYLSFDLICDILQYFGNDIYPIQ